MSQPLTEYELDTLLREAPPNLVNSLRRLLDEVRELRDQAAEAQFFQEQEHES